MVVEVRRGGDRSGRGDDWSRGQRGVRYSSEERCREDLNNEENMFLIFLNEIRY